MQPSCNADGRSPARQRRERSELDRGPGAEHRPGEPGNGSWQRWCPDGHHHKVKGTQQSVARAEDARLSLMLPESLRGAPA